MTLIYILLMSCFLMCFGLLIVLLRTRKKLVLQSEKMAQLSQQQLAIEKQYKQAQEAIHELRSGTIGVGNRVKEIGAELQQLKAKQEDLADLDPSTRLYAKAAKLVAGGASIDELMQECELPRAEAELLFSVHKGK